MRQLREDGMKVAEIMTQPAITVRPETTIAEAAGLLLEHRISGLPVVDAAGEVVGIVTEGDLLRRAETGTERRHARWLEFLITPGRLAREYAGAHARKVGEVMAPDVVSIAPQDPLEEVVRLMETRHIKRLPVIDAGRLVGIVSRANLVRALVDKLARPAAAAAGDGAAIRERILGDIAKQRWAPQASVDVRVSDGVVELYGTITDDRERAALVVLAENTVGVKAVHDQLVWVEPMSGFVIPAEGSEPPGSAA
jgi:CBS-domain-containing membrane protein